MARWASKGALEEEEPTPPSPPAELLLWKQCHEYGALLVEGGVLDQPYLLWSRVRAAGTAYEEWDRRPRPNGNPQGVQHARSSPAQPDP